MTDPNMPPAGAPGRFLGPLAWGYDPQDEPNEPPITEEDAGRVLRYTAPPSITFELPQAGAHELLDEEDYLPGVDLTQPPDRPF